MFDYLTKDKGGKRDGWREGGREEGKRKKKG